MAYVYGVSTDSRDITHDMLKSIDEYAGVLQNNLHEQFCLQALCFNFPVLQLAPFSPTAEFTNASRIHSPFVIARQQNT